MNIMNILIALLIGVLLGGTVVVFTYPMFIYQSSHVVELPSDFTLELQNQYSFGTQQYEFKSGTSVIGHVTTRRHMKHGDIYTIEVITQKPF